MAAVIEKVLIANRGEIACRIARTCRRLGIAAATVHSEADRNALHVREIGESIHIGGAAAAQSYLRVDAILDAARRVGAGAIHPGIGFLAEDPGFAEAVESAGLIFVGPRAETMLRFADKWAAKREAVAAGVPVIQGSEGSSREAAAIETLIRERMRLPVVLKAAAGGGGRGVRIVRVLDGLLGVIESAMREAQSSFGRPDLIVEEFVENARHLEVQVVGDGQGKAMHLFERECSLQRRFQKIIEEAPAANLDGSIRERMLADAVGLAQRVGYRNVGTMEFLVSGDRHFFLECNPRLQVEHTVTEEVTGIDLVEVQLRIAAGGGLPLAQSQVRIAGHAIQARVCAEDPAANFMPATGRLAVVRFPRDARVETGVTDGSEISSYYDSMIAKIIVRGDDRAQALSRLSNVLARSTVLGVPTNLGFLGALLRHPVVLEGRADNRFIDRELTPPPATAGASTDLVAVAAAAWILRRTSGTGPWDGAEFSLGWQYAGTEEPETAVPGFSLVASDGRAWPVVLMSSSTEGLDLRVDGQPQRVRMTAQCEPGLWHAETESAARSVLVDVEAGAVRLGGSFGTFDFTIAPFLSLDAASGAATGQCRAPMMGVIAKVKPQVGDAVNKGDVLVVQESMKMELSIEAPCAGVVKALHCNEGSMVERHQLLVELEPSHE